MPDTTTTNYGFTKPEDGASNNTWGAKLNADLDTIDGLIKTNADAILAKVSKAGDTMTGPLTLSSAAVAGINLTKTGVGAGTAQVYNDGNLNMHSGGATQACNQSGATHGFFRYDATTLLFYIDNDGNAHSAGTLSEGANPVWHAGNLTPAALNGIFGYTPTSPATLAATVANYVLKAGDTVAGNIVRSGAGPHLYHVNSAFGSGRVFATAAGAADPTSAPGDVWIELT